MKISNPTLKLLDKATAKLNTPGCLISAGTTRITDARFSFYFSLSQSTRNEVHNELSFLEATTSSINIQYKSAGFDEHQLLSLIDVLDCETLLRAINVPVMATAINQSLDAISEVLISSADWLHDKFCGLSDAWHNGSTLHRFSFKRADQLYIALKFAAWLEHNGPVNTDYRTASVKAYGDSKVLERNLTSITEVLLLSGKHDPSVDYTPESVLAEWGVSKFSPLIRLRGECQFVVAGKEFPVGAAKPYISMPLEEINAITATIPPRYILFIENLASFERYCREIKDNGIIIFTSGFPSRAWVSLIKDLTARSGAPVYHWGDIDVGGFKILSYLSRALAHPIFPFRMFYEQGSSDTELVLEDMADALQSAIGNPIRGLLETVEAARLSGEKYFWVEQETLDPSPPL